MGKENYKDLKAKDWLIILGLVLFAFIIKVISSFLIPQEVYYQISNYDGTKKVKDNIEPDEYSSLIIQGKTGKMILEFDKEKGARVASSTCPCQVCVNSGWSKNDALVCVPNAVIVKPVNNSKSKENKAVDAVTR